MADVPEVVQKTSYKQEERELEEDWWGFDDDPEWPLLDTIHRWIGIICRYVWKLEQA